MLRVEISAVGFKTTIGGNPPNPTPAHLSSAAEGLADHSKSMVNAPS